MKTKLTESKIKEILAEKIQDHMETLNEGWWDAVKAGVGTVTNDIKTGAQNMGNNIKTGVQNAASNVNQYGQKISQNARTASMQADAEKTYQEYRKAQTMANQLKAKYNSFVQNGVKAKSDMSIDKSQRPTIVNPSKQVG